jgi:hypothetical protein
MIPSTFPVMAKISGNSRRTAKPIALQNRSRTIKDSIGIDDRLDFYQFRVANRSSFNLVLRGLKAKANVALLGSGGQLLQLARHPGQKPRRINTIIDAGLYYVRVSSQGRKGTPYRLQMTANVLETIATPAPGSSSLVISAPGSARPPRPSLGGTSTEGKPTPRPLPSPVPVPAPAPSNTAPVVAVNTQLSINRGGLSRISGNLLRSTDKEQGANQLIFTVTQLPQWGKLQLNGRTLNINETFTQADLDNDRVSYQQQAKTQLVTNQTLVGSPQISGNNVVWAALQEGNSEIFFYNGATGQTRQITSNTVDDVNPQISGSDIVWQRGSGTNTKLFFYDGATGAIKPLSEDGAFADKQPSISSFNSKTTIAWQRDFTDDSDIKIYIGSLDETLSLLGGNDRNPLVSGANVAFERRNLNRPNLGGIYLYNTEVRSLIPVVVNTQTKLTAISGDTIVWEQFLPATQERDVYYATVGEISETIAQNSDYDDFAALVSGSHIVFTRNQLSSDAADGLYLFNIQTKSLKRLSNSAADVATSISGSNVVWQRSNGNQSNIFFYDGTLDRTVPLTNNDAGSGLDSSMNHRHPTLSGANVVWQSGAGTTFNQLFFYNGNATRDRFNFRVSDGELSSNGSFDIAIR